MPDEFDIFQDYIPTNSADPFDQFEDYVPSISNQAALDAEADDLKRIGQEEFQRRRGEYLSGFGLSNEEVPVGQLKSKIAEQTAAYRIGKLPSAIRPIAAGVANIGGSIKSLVERGGEMAGVLPSGIADQENRLIGAVSEGAKKSYQDTFYGPDVGSFSEGLVSGIGKMAMAGATGGIGLAALGADAANQAATAAEDFRDPTSGQGLSDGAKAAYIAGTAAITTLTGHLLKKVAGFAGGSGGAGVTKNAFVKALKHVGETGGVLAAQALATQELAKDVGLDDKPWSLEEAGKLIAHSMIEAPFFVAGGALTNKALGLMVKKPEAAAALAQTKEPSRSLWQKFGLDKLVGERVSAKERAEFAEEIRKNMNRPQISEDQVQERSDFGGFKKAKLTELPESKMPEIEGAQIKSLKEVAGPKTIDEMSIVELKDELFKSPVQGMPLKNKRAYEEARRNVPEAEHVILDGDGLKSINDTFGHEAGDKLLSAIGTALKNSGLESYHISGDEFSVIPRSKADIQKLEMVQKALQDTVLTYKLPDGTIYEHKGVGFSYGTGTDSVSAERALQANKVQREEAGLRPKRGAQLTRVVQEPSTGGRVDNNPPGQPASEVITEPIQTKKPIQTLGSMGGGEVEAHAFDFSAGPSRGESAVKRWLKRNFIGDLPKEVFERNLRREGAHDAAATETAVAVKKFGQAVRESFGTKELNPEQQVAVNNVLQGAKPIESLPQPLREVVSEMRSNITALSRELIRSGAVQGDLAAVVEKNADTYLHRNYRVFTEKDWMKKIAPEEKNRALSALRAEMKGAPEAEIQGALNRLLDPQADSPLGFLAKHKNLGGKDLSILKHRQDLPMWLRRLWGEETDPVKNYVRTVTKQSNLIENHKFLSDVKREGLGKYLFEKPTGDNYVRIEHKGDWSYSPLAGLYTTKPIAEALGRVGEITSGNNPIWNAYLHGVAISKQAKTVLNVPMGDIRNFLGNIGFEVASGRILSTKGLKEAIKGTYDSALANDTVATKLVIKLQKLRVLDGGVEAGEIVASLRDANKQQIDIAEILMPGRGVGKGIKKVLNTSSKLYQAVDNFWKIRAFEVEKARYQKAYPEWSADKVESKAAEIVRNTLPSYSMLPEIIRSMRKIPLTGTFVSFPAEVVRTAVQTAKLAKAEMADPRTASIGSQRVAGMLAAALIPAGIAATSRYLSGVDKDDDTDLRRFVAPWIKNSTIVWLGKNEDGTPSFVDASYMDSHKYLRDPIIAMLSGRDVSEGIESAVSEAMSPWLQENMLASAILDVARNKRGTTGRPIYNEQAPVTHIVGASVKRVWEALEPGAMTQGRRIKMGLTGEIEDTGRKYDPEQEIAAMFTGSRIQSVDIEQSLFFKGVSYAKDKTEAQQILRSKLASKGAVTPQEILYAKSLTERAREELFKELSEDLQAAIRLGVTRDRISKKLKEAGLSKEEIARLFKSNYREYVPREQEFKAKIKRSKAEPHPVLPF